MSDRKQALLLVGSARQPRSTSEALGTYLIEQLTGSGFEGETILLHRALRSDEGSKGLLTAVDHADVIALAFPLYVDSAPATVIRALELVHERRLAGPAQPGQRLLAIINNGFPEAHQNDLAAAVCEQFAKQAGFDWVGALQLGGGGSIAGRPLEEAGGPAMPAIRALDLAAAAIAAGKPVPPEAFAVISKPVIPSWAYRMIGWLGWRMQARQNGVLRKLGARPYEV